MTLAASRQQVQWNGKRNKRTKEYVASRISNDARGVLNSLTQERTTETLIKSNSGLRGSDTQATDKQTVGGI